MRRFDRHRLPRHQLRIMVAIVLTGCGTALAAIALRGTAPEHGGSYVPPAVTASTPAARPALANLALGRSVPTAIRIPAIGVKAPVIRLGLNTNGSIQVPPLANANLTGWYKYGPSPGQRGPAVILGHVDSMTGRSVFYLLRYLHKGERVYVTLRNRKRTAFTVDGVQEVSKSAFPTRAVYGSLPYPALRLITCGGPFDAASGHYRDNVIVYAHLTGIQSLRQCVVETRTPLNRAREGGHNLATDAALPGRSTTNAGPFTGRAHTAGLLRYRVPDARAVRRVALPAHRQRPLPHAGQTMVPHHAGAVRRGRRDRDHLVVRAWPAMAAVDEDLRQRVRARVHARGFLVLPRSHLHRRVRVRLGPAAGAGALPFRHPGRDRGRGRIRFRHRGERVDEPSERVYAARRARGGREPVVRAVREPDVLERVGTHVLRRVHRDRVLHGRRVRGGLSAA